MAEKLNPRMQVLYAETIRPKMVEMFGYKNMMEVPKIDKIVLNMGVGDATQDKKKVDQAGLTNTFSCCLPFQSPL